MRVIRDYEIEQIELERHLICEASRKDTPALSILEAGCGREWYLKPEGVMLRLTGIDLDPTALSFRAEEKQDLHDAIVGDLRTAELPFETFDVVYCSFVLEHVLGAEKALDNMLQSLKPGGLLIVRVPDLHGAQTFLAKRLPRWFAVAYYRYVWKIEKAGQPGFAPYPTFYDPVISRPGFHGYCWSRGLSLVEEYGVGSYETRGAGLVSRLVPYVAKAIAIASGGRIHDAYVDLTYVARKQSPKTADQADPATQSSPQTTRTHDLAPEARVFGYADEPARCVSSQGLRSESRG